MSQPTAPQSGQIDPRGPQFTATLTAVLLVAVLLTAPSPVGIVLLAVQASLFAVGVTFGVQRGPWALAFRRLVRPRLAAPSHLEDPTPPRFAQGVGLVFALVALAGYLVGAPVVGAVATGFALAAALLNAVFRFCLGCEMYLLIRRLSPTSSVEPVETATAPTSGRRGRNTPTENKEKVIA
jgi:hypothetical protein